MLYRRLVWALATALALVPASAATIYVAPNGNDAWTGRQAPAAAPDGPVATLARARDLIRAMKQAGGLPAGGVTVELAAGVYEQAQPFELTAEDSGTVAAPIVYRAAAGAEVRVVGGKELTNFQPVTDPAVLARLDESVRGQVLVADLKALGITDFGEVATNGKRLELFFADRPMTVSRWPNEGFVRIVDVVGGAPHKIHGIPGDKIGRFTYDGDRPQRWVGEPDAWVHGYWFWDWSDERQRIESIDTERKVIAVRPPYHGYGYRKNQWYYAFNVLSELDAPGEYYVDRQAGRLYFLPPAPLAKGKALVSVSPNLLKATNTEHITFRNLILEASRADAVVVSGGANNRVVGCTIRNCGTWAVSMSGLSSGVVGCDISETAAGGIVLSGGDRRSLTPAGLYAENNHIHHYARVNRVYQPGISLNGVGNRATHNLIDNAPHMGMGFSGNDHLIEYNELHSVTYESNDAGAIYTGRNWSMCGTIIRYNYFHHINGWEGRGCVGVYLDDQFGGTTIYGNLFYNVTRAAMIGGGRNCSIENNTFVDCTPATHVDARGLGWAKGGEAGMRKSLTDLPYQSEVWAKRYPWLLTLLDDEPMAPKYNTIARNICVGGRWGDFEGRAKPLVKFEDNLLDQDPKFVDPAALNFRLRDDSPAVKLGIKPLPIDQMGLRNDGTRASWPVASPVRPMLKPPAPAAKAGRKGAAVYQVPRTATPLTPGHPAAMKYMVIEQGIQGELVKPPSRAWLSHDGQILTIVVEHDVDAKQPIRLGGTWGQDDAMELAFRNPALGKNAPIVLLRGYPSGKWESSDETGAPPAVVKKAAEGVEYKAQVVGHGRWTATWRIPFASLGVDPVKHTKLAFNLSAMKAAGPTWVEWQGTGGHTWDVDTAGVLELAR